jgi:hypothetical protein
MFLAHLQLSSLRPMAPAVRRKKGRLTEMSPGTPLTHHKELLKNAPSVHQPGIDFRALLHTG